jgi:hypothetical protein
MRKSSKGVVLVRQQRLSAILAQHGKKLGFDMESLKRWFRSVFLREKTQSIVDEIFAPVDPDKIADNLGVDVLARQSGDKDLPASGAQAPDATEVSIAHAFEQDAQETAKKANDKLQLYRRQLEKLDVKNEAQSVASKKKRFEVESSALLEECRDNLRPFINKRTALHEEKVSFMARNKLEREADYPESRFLHLATLLIIFALESVLNAFFFAQGSDFGLIGGWVQAMQYAGLNLAIAFFISLFLVRHIHHVSWINRLIGWFGALFLTVEIVSFNLFVGHYRELFAAAPEIAQERAIDNFLASPFGLQTTESYLLFAVGVLFAIIAAIDGYRFDDRYPGFGRIARRLEKASEEYLEEKQQIKQYLADLRDETVNSLDETRDGVLQKQDEVLDLSSLAETIRSRCEMHLALLQQCCNVVIARYRQLNSAVRSTPPPEYEVDERKKEITKILRSIETQRVTIQDIYTGTLQKLDDAIQRLEFGTRQ